MEPSHLGRLYRLLRRFVDVPRGASVLARSGSVAILPVAIVERLRTQVRALQGRLHAEVEPAG